MYPWSSDLVVMDLNFYYIAMARALVKKNAAFKYLRIEAIVKIIS